VLVIDCQPPQTPTFLKGDLITPLLLAVQSHGEVKNRKEIIHDSVAATMLKMARLPSAHSSDSAILVWVLLGRFTEPAAANDVKMVQVSK